MLADESDRERIAVGEAIVSFNGGDDRENKPSNGDDGEEYESDENKAERDAGEGVDEARNVKIERLLRLRGPELVFVFFNEVHDEGANDAAQRNQESAEGREVGKHGPLTFVGWDSGGVGGDSR